MSGAGILRILTMRSLSAHQLRFAMTTLAVVLGTAFVAGGFILTASLSKAFDDITVGQYEGADLVLTSTPEHPLTHRLADEIAARPDVEQVEVTDTQPVVLLGPDGAAYQSGGAGTWLLPYLPPEEMVTRPFLIAEGRAPQTATEAVLNSGAAERAGLAVGDRITVIDASRRSGLTLVGITEAGVASGGWAGVQVAADVYRAEYSDGEHTGRILVRGGVPVESLRAAHPGVDIRSAADAAAADSEEISGALSFFTYILLAFGLIALLVGTFIISNTFSMLVAQRTREFALLRAVGMSRPQLTGMVLGEAALIGVAGALLGILGGVGLVRLIVAVMESLGFGLPDAGLGVDAPSILVPLALGAAVTLVSAWVPARRAGRVHPVQAMVSGDQSATQPVGARALTGAVLLVAGLSTSATAAFVTSWSTTTRLVLLGTGAVLVVLAALLLLAAVARHLFSLRPPGRAVVPLLAGTNLSRNPRRTAATAFALTLGVALVSAVGILGASTKESVFGAVEEQLTADAVISAGVVTNQSIPARALADVLALDGVAGRVDLTWVPLSVNGAAGSRDDAGGVSAVLDTDPRQALALQVVDGSFDGVDTRPGVGLSADTAHALGVGVGDTVEVSSSLTPATTHVPVLVVWEDTTTYTGVAVTPAAARDLLPDTRAWFTQTSYLRFHDGADAADTHRRVVAEVAQYGVLQAMTPTEYQVQAAAQIDQLIALIYALLALSVVVAVLGIINTLALSLMERTHEFGMLRAVGMQRGQIRRMVTLESVWIAVVGAVTGILTGGWLGWCLVRALESQGIDRRALPWEQLAVVLVAAVLVGVIAAWWPGRRAARTSPLAAVE